MKNILSKIYLLLVSIFFLLSCSDPSTTTNNTSSSDIDLTFAIGSTTPTEASTGISRTTTISLTFDREINSNTISTNYFTTSCTGAIQVSSDGFTTCVQMSGAPVASNSNKTFTVTPANSLSANTIYRIGVSKSNLRDTNGKGMYESWISPNGFQTSGTTIAQVGSASSDLGYDIAIDSSDNLYLTGYANKIHGNYYSGTFLIKYNSSLSRQWTRQTDGYTGKGVHVDSSGNIVFISNNRDYGKFEESGYATDTQSTKIYKYNSSGEKYWLYERSGQSYFTQLDATSDSSNNYYFTGQCRGNSLDSQGCSNNSAAVLKFNSTGTRQWTLVINGQHSRGHGIVTDTSGNIFITGFAMDTFNSVSNTGAKDLFLTKYNTSVTHQWSKLLGSTSDDVGNEIVMDSSGNLYITGYTEGILDGGTTSGERDLLITKYDSSGNNSWAKQVGNTRSEGRSIAVDSSGNSYVVGYTYGDFDGNTNIGGADIVIVKYNSSGTKQWSYQYGTSSDDFGEGIVVDSAGNLYVTGYTSGNFYGNVNAGGSDFFLMKLNSSGIIQ
ncbi:MAG: SBBP repeat-containing protein [Candidatus Pelagibacter sp.]|nr:SBBP repeat-containing protein [Candidatus Pelagibacter sp.]